MMTDAEEDTVKFEPKSICVKVVIALLVMLVGAAVFMELEREKEDSNSSEILHDANKLKHSLIEKYNINLRDMKKLEIALERETTVKQEQERLSRWTYSNSVFFAFTIMTTIGYGHMSPHTWQGQLFCIFYSLLAIPVAGIMLLGVGNHVSLAIRVLIRFLEKSFPSGVVWGSAKLKSTLVTVALMILMIIFGAILTSHTDDWYFREGAYFYFISVSTIGFGDYVVNDGQLKSSEHTKTIAVHFTIVLITLGLCVLSSVLCSVSAAIEERQNKIRIHMENSAVNAVGAAESALNSVTSNFPLRLSRKDKDKNCKEGEDERSINQNLGSESAYASRPDLA
ncbi:two pore potassium channel protein sup-9-like [Montipora capricornis]|uniref:two pore potassium channel protein sup-9-like n=1 Tax=Montipora capricornis TaxID=246305 RepID=UPI0035F205CF